MEERKCAVMIKKKINEVFFLWCEEENSSPHPPHLCVKYMMFVVKDCILEKEKFSGN